jgi:hypothetical protein
MELGKRPEFSTNSKAHTPVRPTKALSGHLGRIKDYVKAGMVLRTEQGSESTQEPLIPESVHISGPSCIARWNFPISQEKTEW